MSSSWLLYRSSAFDYDKWLEWLDAELRSVAQNTDYYTMDAINDAKENIATLISSASSDITLLDFITIDQVIYI